MSKYATTNVPDKRYNPKGHRNEQPSGKTGSKSVNEDGSSGKYFSTSGGFAADKSSLKNPPNAKKEKDKKQENTSEEEIEVIDLDEEIRTGKAKIVSNDSTDKSPKFKAESYSRHHPERHTTGGPSRPKERPQYRRYAESDSFDSDPPAKPAYRSHHKDKVHSSHKPPKPKEKPQYRRYVESDSFDSDPPAKSASRRHHTGKTRSSRKSPEPKAKPASRRPYIESPADSYSESDQPVKPAFRQHTKERRSDHGSSALPRSFTEPMPYSHAATYTAPAEYPEEYPAAYPAAYPEPYSAVPAYVADYTEEPRRTSSMGSYSQRGYDRDPRPSSSTFPVRGTRPNVNRTYLTSETYVEYDDDYYDSDRRRY